MRSTFFNTIQKAIASHPVASLGAVMSVSTAAAFALENKFAHKNEGALYKTAHWNNAVHAPVFGPLAGILLHTAAQHNKPAASFTLSVLFSATIMGTMKYFFAPQPQKYKLVAKDSSDAYTPPFGSG